MTMATAGADGDPWVSPVYFAAGDRDGLLWVSEPGTRHSLNIAARPRIAVVIFDSRVAIGEAQALYGSGEAAEVAGEQLETAIAAFSRGSQADGAGAWSVEEVTAPLACASIGRRSPPGRCSTASATRARATGARR